jgi:uncharacterized Ntn-hydrolase superfamily protein
MTLSLLARCAKTGRLGMVIASSSPAVAARCAHVRAGVGVAASQNITDPALGPALLDALGRGRAAREALAEVAAAAAHVEYRQLLVVDAAGRTAVRTGAKGLGTTAEAAGDGAVAAGNLLAVPGVPAAMVAAFADTRGALADRLLAGLQAGVAAGGEAGPLRSAGLLVAHRLDWPEVDLRVDWDETDPVAALGRLWGLYGPQAADYVMRAERPDLAPGFGVPGDP